MGHLKGFVRKIHSGSKKKSASSSLNQRLQQLQEDAYLSNPRLGERLEEAIRNQPGNPSSEYQPENPSSGPEYQPASSISKLPSYADKQTREIATSRPWTGEISAYDISSRYKSESRDKPKKVNRQEKLHNAREDVLDYRLSKHEKKSREGDADDGWRQMYKERLLGPTMLVSDTFAGVDSGIKSLADQKIMEAQRRGDFKNIKRGKPLQKGYTNTNAFIDRTEYHLNRIMKEQEAIPPWIEKQRSTEVEIEHFRRQLDKAWTLRAVRLVEELFPGLDKEAVLNKMQEYASSGGVELRSKEWEDREKKTYLTFKVRKLNDSIRGYNLQAPLASQKLYLNEDNEVQDCYKRVNPRIVAEYKKIKMKSNGDDNAKGPQSERRWKPFCGALGRTKIPQRTNIPQMPVEPLSQMFWKLFKGDH
ncbi:hypothetical protein FOA43_002042 [Brettanomyces nanus]|uniref:DnaJ homologue subfamily C member 28 conserved domain-containing protein n=1 Tax=Eeniella nana TaxID=13502 RepID=A0A875S4L1_EENNA|nr:uncharacterized protein FOA43_002042 [Brettanomyces nanus]QPG74709.1 hypothetical protein FOA43_002042 [Brettanomyces nanus]